MKLRFWFCFLSSPVVFVEMVMSEEEQEKNGEEEALRLHVLSSSPLSRQFLVT